MPDEVERKPKIIENYF
jgi:hypothetical protein